MKKLTAGIFTVLLGLVAANSADAAVASKGYVDEMVGENTTAIATLSGTVDGHTQSIADLDAADTAINAKIGEVETGKTLAGMIADAKQEAIDAAGEAEYDDTEIRGMIAGKENSSNKVSAVSQDWSEEEKQQYYPSVFLTEDMIQSSTNALGALANQNKAAITTINNSAVMNSGITADKVTAYDAYAEEISDNATAAANAQAAAEAAQGAADAAQDAADANALAIAAINNTENGFLKQAETAAKSYADGVAATAKSEAVTEANSYADSLADNYDAAGSAATALTDAKSYADSLAANYDAAGAAATALTDAKSYADGVAATAKSEAITAAKSAGDAAYAAKSYEDRVEANETAIAANTAAAEAAQADADAAQDAADAAQGAADAAQQTANNAIPKPSGECADANNKCVLTFNNAQYAWEVIERATGE